MKIWYAAQETCRGSYDHAEQNRACPIYERAGEKLAAHGWCWDYPDKPAAQAEWHRCSEDAAKDAPVEDIHVERIKGGGMTLSSHSADGDDALRTASYIGEPLLKYANIQLHASPSLKRYETILDDLNRYLIFANLATQCGLRARDWHDAVRQRIEADVAANSELATLRPGLSPDELKVAAAFVRGRMELSQNLTMANGYDQGCASVASMPFLRTIDQYGRGE